MKSLRYIPVIFILALVFAACVKESNYPDTPQITYNSFIPFCSGSTIDSAYLRINFTDGNGNIGYDAQDAQAPYDFYALELINYNGAYIPLLVSSDSEIFKYHIPNITPAGKNKSLNGIIQINFESAFGLNEQLGIFKGYNYYEIEFQVWIYDRAGNKSNVITTPPLSICQ